MPACDYCEIAWKKVKTEIVYEDDKIIAIIKDRAAFPGHILVMPREHYTILELVPDHIITHLFKIVNKLSIATFESLGVQGTNILVNNGTASGQKTPHFCVEIIPRKEGDKLDFEWKPKQLMEEEMDTAHLTLKEEGDKIILREEEKKEEVFKDEKTEMVAEKEGEENYLLKQLRRVP